MFANQNFILKIKCAYSGVNIAFVGCTFTSNIKISICRLKKLEYGLVLDSEYFCKGWDKHLIFLFPLHPFAKDG